MFLTPCPVAQPIPPRAIPKEENYSPTVAWFKKLIVQIKAFFFGIGGTTQKTVEIANLTFQFIQAKAVCSNPPKSLQTKVITLLIATGKELGDLAEACLRNHEAHRNALHKKIQEFQTMIDQIPQNLPLGISSDTTDSKDTNTLNTLQKFLNFYSKLYKMNPKERFSKPLDIPTLVPSAAHSVTPGVDQTGLVKETYTQAEEQLPPGRDSHSDTATQPGEVLTPSSDDESSVDAQKMDQEKREEKLLDERLAIAERNKRRQEALPLSPVKPTEAQQPPSSERRKRDRIVEIVLPDGESGNLRYGQYLDVKPFRIPDLDEFWGSSSAANPVGKK